jgi:hypothetical protein
MSSANCEFSVFSLLHFLIEEKLFNEISPLSPFEQAHRYTDLKNKKISARTASVSAEI